MDGCRDSTFDVVAVRCVVVALEGLDGPKAVVVRRLGGWWMVPLVTATLRNVAAVPGGEVLFAAVCTVVGAKVSNPAAPSIS